MGTWISHLRIAENLLAHIPGLDEAAFAYGNLAPDSGVPNADWSAFDPPKTVTHFLNEGEGEGRIRDLEFYRQYLADPNLTTDRANYSFRLGYFFHLICDNLWALRIWHPCQRAHAADYAENAAKFVEAVKKDWYGLDHKYLRENPASLFWRVLLPSPNPPAYLPFVPEAALHQQFNYIKNYYDKEREPAVERPYPYLNATMMARHVADSTAAILHIHRALAEQPLSEATPTTVAFLPKREVPVYESPLGDVTN